MKLVYLRDVGEVLAGLEKAKTAMRAMSKYVPVNLVRQLYYKGEEPLLGGKSAELSVLFTDIKDFTAFAESIAPDRLNYTAIGDGINLTSRLEGLNKYYGTHIIASEGIHAAAQDAFDFRLLDCVAVKGKTEGMVIYELLAERMEGRPRPDFVDRYEQAFASYQRGDFAAPLGLLEGMDEDFPSRVLANRCREFLSHPPANWNGIHIFDSK